MKKIFTLLFALLAVVGVQAQTSTKLDIGGCTAAYASQDGSNYWLLELYKSFDTKTKA
jgi:hypothetical protein